MGAAALAGDQMETASREGLGHPCGGIEPSLARASLRQML
jgi:hypothetical protein